MFRKVDPVCVRSFRQCSSQMRYLVLVLVGLFLVCWYVSNDVGIVFPLLQQEKSIPNTVKTIDCFFNKTENILPEISTVQPRKSSSIFFHETSCGRWIDGKVVLSARQACAVESAALLNPDSEVYLLFTSPISAESLKEWLSTYLSLQRYPNVRVMHLDIERYFKDTPLENWYQDGAALLKASKWPSSHTSDVLRYLTLWKYGGTYLDLDFIITKSFNNTKNFVGMDEMNSYASAAMNFANDDIGHVVATECLRITKQNFRGDIWSQNGPRVVSQVINHVCGIWLTRPRSPDQCHGFTVYPVKAFYPIHWLQWNQLFDEDSSDRTMAQLTDSLAVHTSASLSNISEIRVGSRQPYALLAEKYCPLVNAVNGPTF